MIKNKKFSDAPSKQDSKADWTKKIKIEDGEAITIRLLRPLNTMEEESNGNYAEFQHEFRDIWFPQGDKPDGLKGRAITMPILDFETPNSEHLSPMNYLADHPELVKTPSGKPVAVSKIKRNIDIVVQATPVYNQTDAKAYGAGGAAFDFSSGEQRIFNPSITVYRELLNACAIYEAENGEYPLGVPIMIKRSGKNMQDTRYTITMRADKKDKKFDAYGVEIEVNLQDYIYFQEFEQQMNHLSNLGIVLPISNPDGEEFEPPVYEDEEELAA